MISTSLLAPNLFKIAIVSACTQAREGPDPPHPSRTPARFHDRQEARPHRAVGGHASVPARASPTPNVAPTGPAPTWLRRSRLRSLIRFEPPFSPKIP